MRLLPRIVMAGFAGVALAAPVAGPAARRSDRCRVRSSFCSQGETLLAAGKLRGRPRTSLETALAVDPRNRGAFVDLARVAEKQQLFGKAIRMTNKALLLEPERSRRDRRPGRGDGRARRACPRAKDNLAKLQKLCAKGCPQLRDAVRGDQPRPDGRGRQAAGKPRRRTSSSARASATNSSTLSVSARRSLIDPELFERVQRARQPP